MMFRSKVCAGLVCALALAGVSGLRADDNAAKDIVDTAVAAGQFKTLAKALTEADLVETLKGKGPFTVFAPTDEAFAKLPEGTLEALLKDKAKLKAILTYHVVAGKVMAADVVKLDSAKTVQGQKVKIQVNDGKVKIDGANVTKTDIVTSNGVIHIIDAVILPDLDQKSAKANGTTHNSQCASTVASRTTYRMRLHR
jgi:uncharacterized surface protein with fasciclin (FAS1) repeats